MTRLTVFAFLLVSTAGIARPIAAAERPNVIFFLSDDQRADFLGCAGHPIVKTPNVDALASRGTRFENAFVTTSICAASRATLFTGLWERSHKYTFGTPAIAPGKIDASYRRCSSVPDFVPGSSVSSALMLVPAAPVACSTRSFRSTETRISRSRTTVHFDT